MYAAQGMKSNNKCKIFAHVGHSKMVIANLQAEFRQFRLIDSMEKFVQKFVQKLEYLS